MGKLRIPDTRKIIGFNIAPKLSHGTVRPYENMVLEWDWAGWIKPQIDLCAGNGIGLNAVRLIGASMGVIDMFTQAYYDSREAQIVEYCASLGLHYYPTGFGKSAYQNVGAANAPIARVTEILATSLLKLQQYENVIGVDLVQEANNTGIIIPSDAFIIQLIANLKAAGVTLPMTCSTSETNVASSGTAPWVYAMGVNFDFIDVHNYTYPITMQALDGLRAAFPDKDMLIGEFGRAKSVGTTRVAPDLRQVMDLVNSGDQRIRGGLIWAATDQDTVNTNQWGVYSSSLTVDNQDLLTLLRRYTGGSVALLNRRQA